MSFNGIIPINICSEINRSTNDLLYFLISLGVSFISIIAAQRKDTLSFIVASLSLVCVFTFFIRFMKMYFSNNQIKVFNTKTVKNFKFHINISRYIKHSYTHKI